MNVDIAKVRAHLRKLDASRVFVMLHEALGMLSKPRLAAPVQRHLPLADMLVDASRRSPKPTLLPAVKDFVARSRRGDYFEPFAVDSKTCTQESAGTTSWILDCNQLLDRCVARARVARGRSEALAAFEILFDAIDLAATCEHDIVFFADEGGLWSFGIDWKRVVAAWTLCAAAAEAGDGALEARAMRVLTRFGKAWAAIARFGGARAQLSRERAARQPTNDP